MFLLEERNIDTSRIDVQSRSVDLSGEVNVELYRVVLHGIRTLGINEPITFYLNTYGGDLYQGFAIYDLIKSVPQSEIICVGPVMSAGAVILQAGKIRSSLPNAQFMVHYGEESSSSLDDSIQNRKMFEHMKDIIKERVTVKPRTVNSWFRAETYFTAQEALEKGLIDEIMND